VEGGPRLREVARGIGIDLYSQLDCVLPDLNLGKAGGCRLRYNEIWSPKGKKKSIRCLVSTVKELAAAVVEEACSLRWSLVLLMFARNEGWQDDVLIRPATPRSKAASSNFGSGKG
jgi:hypothetical protein